MRILRYSKYSEDSEKNIYTFKTYSNSLANTQKFTRFTYFDKVFHIALYFEIFAEVTKATLTVTTAGSCCNFGTVKVYVINFDI